jgi:hypothetical protein
MGEGSETIKSSEEVLTDKRGNLKDKLRLMLDYRAAQIQESILPRLDEFTNLELDYLLKCARYSDNQQQLRGPLARFAKERQPKIEEELKEIENQIGPDRAKEFRDLFYIEDRN